METPKLSKSEKEIMSVFWLEGRPLSSSEIVALSPNKTWRANSIHILLNNLLDKKAIRVAGTTKIGKHASRTFEPTYPESEGLANEIRAMVSFQREPVRTVASVFSSLMGALELTDEQREELNDLLKEEIQ